MNRIQKTIALIGTAAFLFAGIYAPFTETYAVGSKKVESPAKYYWLFSPPASAGGTEYSFAANRLVMTWLVIIVASCVLIAVFADRNTEDRPTGGSRPQAPPTA